MMKWFVIWMLLFAWPVAAQQSVSVQSGEHGDFTRLVLQVDPKLEWQLTESRGSAVISFPDQNLSFATENIYDRISTARIAEVGGVSQSTGSEFMLMLNCSCKLQVNGYNDKYLIVDVLDGPDLEPIESRAAAPLWQPDSLPFIQAPPLPNRFLGNVLDIAPAQPVLAQTTPANPPSPESVLPEAMAMLAAPAEPDDMADMEATAGAVVGEMNATVKEPDNPEMRIRLEEAQSQLLAQLTRAADQGLVNFVTQPIETVEEITPEPVVELQPDPPKVEPELLAQLSARTAYGSTTEDALAEIINQFAMPQCLGDERFSVENWQGESDFSSELAKLRLNLLGEFDKSDPEIELKIIQLYLYYGLGAEALLLISEWGDESEQFRILNDLSLILEGKPTKVTGPTTLGAGCGGAHEMWYLAVGLGDYSVLEPLEITDVFSSYPLQIRRIIGPPLAEAFIRRGQIDAGHVVLEIVRRANGEVTVEQRLAEARIFETQGNLEQAEMAYKEIIVSRDTNAPQAMMAYARLLLNADRPLPSTLLVDLESAAFFNRNSEKGNELRIWEIRVRAAVEGNSVALAQIAENLLENVEIFEELTQLVSEIFVESTAEKVGDYQYAQMVLTYAQLLDQGAQGDLARLKIAKEMASIGLPETALDVLAPNLARPNLETTYVLAAAKVQLFEPREALTLLDADPSLAAYKIRLRANLQLEDYSAVAAMLEEENAKEISVDDIALRAGEWAKIQNAGAMGTLATYMMQPDIETAAESLMQSADGILAPMQSSDTPSLSAARDLLEVNRASRSFIEEVLAEGQP